MIDPAKTWTCPYCGPGVEATYEENCASCGRPLWQDVPSWLKEEMDAAVARIQLECSTLRSQVQHLETTRTEASEAAFKAEQENERLRGSEWLVLRAREQEPIEVWRFMRDEAEARAFFDSAAAQWTETFLVRAVAGPGNPPPSIPLHPLQAEITQMKMRAKADAENAKAAEQKARECLALLHLDEKATLSESLAEIARGIESLQEDCAQEAEKAEEGRIAAIDLGKAQDRVRLLERELTAATDQIAMMAQSIEKIASLRAELKAADAMIEVLLNRDSG